MSETIEVEIDDIHELMFKDLFDGEEEAPELDEWAENAVQNILYTSYQQRDA